MTRSREIRREATGNTDYLMYRAFVYLFRNIINKLFALMNAWDSYALSSTSMVDCLLSKIIVNIAGG